MPTISILAAFLLPSFEAPAEEILPAQFDHDRVFVSAVAPDGKELLFYTDTGGGFNAVAQSVAATYSLAEKRAATGGDEAFKLVEFPAFVEKSGVPAPAPDPWLGGNLAVVPDDRLESDGFLGSRWFAGKVWMFDYPEEKLSRLTTLDVPADFTQMLLGFRTDDEGVRDLNFPRMTIQIDGEPLEMLLDTGATAILTESSAAEYDLPPGTRVGTSYIVRSRFESWRTRHPDWKVVMDGESVTGQTLPMIKVPEVQVAGISVGPVWFSVRSDHTFHDYMSQMMDKQVEGAVGGSMLKHLQMVIDYPAAKAHFRLPADEGTPHIPVESACAEIGPLLEDGADISARDAIGATPLMRALEKNLPGVCVRALLRAGADPNATHGSRQISVLMIAASYSTAEVVSLLLQRGAEVDFATPDGWTALMSAARNGSRPGVIGELVAGGANVNALDQYGVTPLMRAAQTNPSQEIIEALVRLGADTTIENRDGHTAYELAKSSGRGREVLGLLAPDRMTDDTVD